MTTPVPRLYPPGGAQLTLKLTQGGQEAAVVLGGFDGSAASPITAARAQAWRDAAWTAFRPLIISTTELTGAIMREVDQAEGTAVEVGPPTANATGSYAGSAALAAGCTLLKWSTGRGGRSGKGRTFLPGLPQEALGVGARVYGPSFQTAGATAVNAYLTAAFFTSDSLKPAVLSFTKGEANVILAGSLSAVVGTQRRRMR